MKKKFVFFMTLFFVVTLLASCEQTKQVQDIKNDDDANDAMTQKYTVRFNSDGGTFVESQTVKFGDKAVEPPVPKKEGYTFNGWYLDDEKWSFQGYTVTSDITLVAEWRSNFKYTFDSTTNTYAISGVVDKTHTSLTIPSHYNNYPINSIEKNAFRGCNYLTDLIIPEGVSFIKDNAFSGCISLVQVKLPDGLKTIGIEAFSDCYKLTGIEIPDSIEYIGNDAFKNCDSLIVENNGLLYVDNWIVAADIGSNLEINIKDTTNGVLPDVFRECQNLKSVYITDLSAWCKMKFCNSASNPLYYAENLYLNNELLIEICIPDDISLIRKYAFERYYRLEQLTIPGTVKEIDSYAFSYCENLMRVTLEEGVASIGQGAFKSCHRLNHIDIPSSIISIGSEAFKDADCDTVVIHDLAKWCNISFGDVYANPLYYAERFYNGQLITNLVIPEDVAVISAFAFCDMPTNITKVTIADSITTIGNYAFSGCSGLTSVSIGDSVTSIGAVAFKGCTNLTSIDIPDSVTSIGEQAFFNCENLASVKLGDSIKNIGQQAFSYCGLERIIIPKSLEYMGAFAFSGCPSLTIYCEAEGKPTEWNSHWNYDNYPVVWGYTGEE